MKEHLVEPIPVITIDGPTASGKGTIAKEVARKLRFHYLDSGALYRLVALAGLREQVDWTNVQALIRLVHTLDMTFEENCIRLAGEEVSQAIREERVGNQASVLATYAPVREALVARQRAFRMRPGLVADGRDMGTVIFPDADLKIFLTAAVEVRARRRYEQLRARGFSVSIGDILHGLQARDARDNMRLASPLVAASDAKTIDTSHFCVEEVVAKVMRYAFDYRILFNSCCGKSSFGT
jgi:cytidylate kinase